MNPVWLIAKKRDGEELTPDEIGVFIAGYAQGDIPDYQMSALAMAI
jgi:pyrimidine-nucleoside phosphorylase